MRTKRRKKSNIGENRVKNKKKNGEKPAVKKLLEKQLRNIPARSARNVPFHFKKSLFYRLFFI